MLTILAFILIILLTLLIGDVGDNVRAFWRIITAPGLLLTDPLSINRDYGGNLNGLLMNTFLTTGLSLLIVKLSKTPFEGVIIASIFTVAGFTFIGKNVMNVMVLYAGVMLYARFKKIELKQVMAAMLLSSGIAPVFSYFMFGLGVSHLPMTTRIPLAIGVGLLTGFLIPIVAAQALKFHAGFNLYNVGFTMGLLAVGIHGFLRSFGIHVQPVGVPLDGYPDYTLFLMISIGLLCIGMIGLAFILDRAVLKKYKLILNETGQLSTNFSQIAGQAATVFNMGIMGLMSLVIVIPILIIVDIPFLGILVAGVITIIGFAAFGKHPSNTLPIFIGTLMGFFVIRAIDSPFTTLIPTNNPEGAYRSSINIHAYTCAIFFATCLAPISKKYGPVAGIIAGFFHMMIVVLGGNFQGGFNLYNNGWVAGFVAGILVPIFEAFRKKSASPPDLKLVKN